MVKITNLKLREIYQYCRDHKTPISSSIVEELCIALADARKIGLSWENQKAENDAAALAAAEGQAK